jgi:type I restriction enzyme S subunit
MTVEELAADEPRSICDGPFGSKLKSAHYTDEGPRVIRLQNIGDGEFLDARAHVSEDHFKTLKNHRIYAGDLVIAALGTDPPRACMIPDYVGPAIVKADCIRFKPAEEHSAKYLLFALNSPGVRKRTKAIVHGVGRPRLNQKEIKAIRLPVAPPDKQRRIVARIEELFSRLDAGVAALRHAKAQLQRYRQSVLAAAVTGQLTEEWREQHPDTEPADELLERVLEKRKEAWTKKTKFKEPASVDQSALPQLPAGWIWCTTDQLGQPTEQPVLTGPFGSNLGRNDFVPDGEVNVLTIGCLLQSGIDLSKALKITKEKADDLDRYKLRIGDLLFTRMASVGRAGFVTPDLAGSIFNYHIMRLRLSDAMLPGLFVSYVQSSPVVSKYVRNVNHGATRDGINTQQLLSLPVPLAPLAEQHQIVAEVEARTTAIDHLEAELDHQITRSNSLRQSTLAEAFAGQL